jgi:hypothetical protein
VADSTTGDNTSNTSDHISNTSDHTSNTSDHESKTNRESCKKDFQTIEITDNVYKNTIELEFAQIAIKQAIDGDNGKAQLNILENNKLTELLMATSIFRYSVTRITSEITCILDAFKMTERGIRNLIKISKKLNAFTNLCQHDQIALLKGGSSEILMMRAVSTINVDKNFFIFVTVCQM